MSKSTTLEIIPISQIELSHTNPRKSFDKKALEELSQSIKEHGILQPILVRPNVDEKSYWEDYQLVCGERRYRAALLAGLEEIPVNIRTLTDDEAFELQIIENLERKDVHPLDEADAFKKMLDSGKYQISDIAAKMAKTESFIAQRLKLVDLIDSIRTDFIAGHLGIGHAILIARCDEIKQMDIYKEAQPYNEHHPIDYGTIKDLKETIEDDSFLLSEANFDLSDTTLVPGICACNICPKRSGANPVLFDDMQDDRCFDINCFDDKLHAFMEKEVAKIINEGIDTPILANYTKPSDMIITICKQYNVQILANYNDWNTYSREGWDVKTGFLVSGSDQGKYIEVFVKPQSIVSNSSGESKTPLNNEQVELQEEISKIKSRQARALELDAEKVWTEIRSIDTSFIKNSTLELDSSEINALAYALYEKLNWDKRKEFEFQDNPIFDSLDSLKKLMRIFYLDVLPSSFGSHLNNKNNASYYKVMLKNAPAPIKEIEDRIQEVANKRIGKANDRILDLDAKIANLKPAEIVDEVEAKSKPIKAKKVK